MVQVVSVKSIHSADGTQLVAAAGARVFVYDIEGNPIHALKGHAVRTGES
jgi:hypothetical protein